MPKLIVLKPSKTYATRENAVKAVEKVFSTKSSDCLRYIIMVHIDGRFFPVFIGEAALSGGAHFDFHVLA